MDERDWKLLVTLHQERNLTRTAQQLYVSQPAVSYRLQQLEETIGMKIVVRRRSGIEFTPAGTELVNYARNMLRQLERLRDTLAAQAGTVRGELRLGVSRTFARYVLADLLKDFIQQFPSIDISVRTGLSSEILTHLMQGDVHVAIVRGQHRWNGTIYSLGTDPIYIVSAKALDLVRLPDEPRIRYATDPSFEPILDEWWSARYGSQVPRTLMEVDNLDTCKSFVLANLGYAILPGIAIADTPSLWRYPLTDSHGAPIERETSMMCHDEDISLMAVQRFIDFVRFKWARPES